MNDLAAMLEAARQRHTALSPVLDELARVADARRDADRRIAQAFAKVRVFDELGAAIERFLSELPSIECAVLYVRDIDSASLRMVWAKGLALAERAAAEVTAEARCPGLVARTGGALCVVRSESGPISIDACIDDLGSAHRSAVQSYFYTPVRADGVVIGALGCASADAAAFTSEHRATLAFLAELAGVSYARIVAQQESDHRGLIIEAARGASELLLASIDWGHNANAALAIIGSGLGAGTVALLELQPEYRSAPVGLLKEFTWQPLFGVPWPHAQEVMNVARAQQSRLADTHSVALALGDSRLKTLLKPVFDEGVLWGVLVVEPSKEAPRELERSELLAVRMVADAFGTVIARQRLDEQMRQKQKSEAVGLLAEGIAHDFNNLLWPILLYSEMLEASVGTAERPLQMLRDMQQSARGLSELVQQVLAISRRRDRLLELVPVAEVAIAVSNDLRRSLPSGVALTTSIDADVGVVLGDITAFRQALMQLAANSIAAIARAGADERAIARAGTVHIGVESEYRSGRRVIRVVVEDDGIGMDAGMRKHIFDPYVRGHPQEESHAVSAGLGLSIVQRVVSEMDGQISVESAPGEGARFEIVLPVTRTQSSDRALTESLGALPEAPQSDNKQAHVGECVLFVDDDSVVLDVGQQMLECLGYRVIARDCAASALEVLRDLTQPLALLLTDLTMPQMDGIELARESKRLRPDLRVVLCTGFSDPQTEISAIDAGIAAVLRKPIHLDVFASTLRRVIDAL